MEHTINTSKTYIMYFQTIIGLRIATCMSRSPPDILIEMMECIRNKVYIIIWVEVGSSFMKGILLGAGG